ncbi:GroES-like protein [Tricholoma matsutake]|nr:GroES-like protein [Tricholoma matsutake 945]
MSPIALPTQNAAVLYGPKDIRIDERTLWPPSMNQAQVSIASTGLCGSDMHYYAHGRNADFAVQAPLVLGHEAAGIITAVGPGVKNLTPGQRVAIEAGICCRTCDFCKKGRYNLCKGMRFCSSAAVFPHADGTLQQRMNHPAHALHPLPDNCTFEQASLAEPLSVVIHATRRANLSAGQSVLVLGCGTIGLLVCALAQAIGASRVVVVDINKPRLDFAKSNSFASQTFCLSNVSADKAKTTDDQLRRAKESAQSILAEFKAPEGFDVVFECTGAEPAIQMSVHTAITGGKVMLIGMGTTNVMFPISAAAVREVDIQSSFRYANTYPAAIALLASGKLKNVEKLVTHRFPLKDTKRAFDLLCRGQDEEGKMVLKIMVSSS